MSISGGDILLLQFDPVMHHREFKDPVRKTTILIFFDKRE
jgi:hypothetical protein